MAVRALCSQYFLAVRAFFFLAGGGGWLQVPCQDGCKSLSSQYFFGCKSLISMAAKSFFWDIFFGGVRTLFPFSSDLKLTC